MKNMNLLAQNFNTDDEKLFVNSFKMHLEHGNDNNIILSRSGSFIHNILFVCCHHFPNGIDLIW